MYGIRARIGYCSPPLVTESFCYEFYKMAPAGVTMMITTLAVTSMTGADFSQQVEESYRRSLAAARAMAGCGATVVVLGGNPINQSRGMGNLDKLCDDLSREIGTKVVTSAQAQMHALQALGAKKVATVHPFVEQIDDDHDKSMRNLGCENAGVIGAGYSVEKLAAIPSDVIMTLSRRIKKEHPEADTIHPSCAHWGTAHAIDQIESELGVNVMTSQQAILWKALRTAGIEDKIQGYGRLLREF